MIPQFFQPVSYHNNIMLSQLHTAGHFHCHCSEDMTTQWLDIKQIVVWFSTAARNLSLIQSIQSRYGTHSVYIQSALRALHQGDKVAGMWSRSLIAYLVPRLRKIQTIHLLSYMPPCYTEGPQLSVKNVQVFSLPWRWGLYVVRHLPYYRVLQPRPQYESQNTQRNIMCIFCVCVCVWARERADSVIYNKVVSLLGHQHTLFQD